MRPALNEMNTASLAVYLMLFGAIAQLGERLHGMQEVGGSIPPSSTNSNILNVFITFCYVIIVFNY